MIESNTLVVLDTNVLVHLVRGSSRGAEIADRYELRKRPEAPLISAVTVGECLALAEHLKWGAKKRQELEKTLLRLVTVDVNRPGVLKHYAQIYAFARKEGLGGLFHGQNDMWIAATAAAAAAPLLTTDADFEPLNDRFIKVIRV